MKNPSAIIFFPAFGKQPVDIKLQTVWYEEKSDGGPEWPLQFQVQLQFLK